MSEHEEVVSDTIVMENKVDLDMYKVILKCPVNIEEKMLIAKNVMQSLSITNEKGIPANDVLSEIHQLTGVDEATLKAICSSLPIVKTFSDWFHEKSLEDIHSSCVTFENLRNIITRMYTENLTIVTVPKLLNILKQIDSSCDESKLRNDIKQHGFTWKRLPGTNRSMVVEKTSQFMERMAYLTKVRQYRTEGRSFIYLNVDKYVAVSGFLGLVNVDFVTNTNDSKFNSLQRWFLNTLQLFLPPKCVLVASKKAREQCIVIPNCSSTTRTIWEWLKENNIAYDPHTPKAELFSLVKKYERSCPKAICHTEELLKSYGHEILWRPTGLPALDYFSRVVIDYNIFAHGAFEDLTSDDWEKHERDLIETENKIYFEDLKLEEVIDKLLTLAKYGELSTTDLEECDDILPDDEYISNLIQ